MPEFPTRVECWCRNCGVGFSVASYRFRRGDGVFCCRACYYEWHRRQRVVRTCQHCGMAFEVQPSDLNWSKAAYCTRRCWGMARAAAADAAFWDRLTGRENPDGCWLWTGSRSADGYGLIFRASGESKAHREAWRLANGPIPDGMSVLHRCDVPACCNPAHLFLGTQAENMADAARKGRMARHAGEAHPAARLSDAQVAEIRARYAAGERQVPLAAEFGVAQAHVSRLVRGTSRKPAH